MLEEISKITGIYLLSAVKFIFGPTMGYAAELNIFLTMGITAGGMMTTVVLFTYFGSWIRRRFLLRITRKRRKKVFTKRNRRFVKIWKAYGAPGVAFLTPILLMPIGGTLLLASTGTPKGKIFLYMLISAIGWSIIQTIFFYELGDRIGNYVE